MSVVKVVKHIDFIQIQKYFESKYQFQHRPYWDEIIEDHMFRGNDSSKTFYCQILEEVFPENLAVHFIFLNPKILNLLTKEEPEDILKEILTIPARDFIEAYHQVFSQKETLLKNLGEEAYFYGYMIRSLMESAIISEYKLKDYLKPKQPYFYHFSW